MKRTRLLFLAALSVTAAACGAESPGDVEPIEPIGSATGELVRSPMYVVNTQQTGFADIDMGLHSACFITSVLGNMQNLYWISIYSHVPNPSDPFTRRWRLAVSGNDGLQVSAACIDGTTALTPTSSWHTGQAPVNLGSDQDRACFLTYMSGPMRSTNDIARVRISNGNWYLDGTNSAQGLSLSAACLTGVVPIERSPSEVLVWPPVNTYTKKNLDQPADSGSVRAFCGLTTISGVFDSPNDWVGVHQTGSPVWYLHGLSNGTRVMGGARCIRSDSLYVSPPG
jgi:hypothetical protein